MNSGMDAERWAEVEACFDRLVELDIAEQKLALEDLRESNPELIREVESLLEQESLIQTNGLIPIAPITLNDSNELLYRPGDQAGKYQLVHLVAQSRNSEVWCAETERNDRVTKVAIKFLRTDASDKWFEKRTLRFQNEAQVLLQLKHPNIAKLEDAGRTDDGNLFLAIEWIEGERINEYCDNNQLTVHQRVKLLTQVMDAISYAHRFLVVHRDIKPDNILVSKSGKPFVLDFGISKILATDEMDLSGEQLTPNLTMTVERPMTPAYASPEQVKGRSISTSTDVYGLGLLTYELLSGHHAYSDVAQTKYDDVFDRASQGVPRRPSECVEIDSVSLSDSEGRLAKNAQLIAGFRQTTPAKLKKVLIGKLDAIVSKSLNKNPDERYPSVQDFRSDLINWAENRPIAASGNHRSIVTLIRRFPIRSLVLGCIATALLFGSLLWMQFGWHQKTSSELEATRDELAESQIAMEAITGQPVAAGKAELLLSTAQTQLSLGNLSGASATIAELIPAGVAGFSDHRKIELADVYLRLGKITKGLNVLEPWCRLDPEELTGSEEFKQSLRPVVGGLYQRAGWPFLADKWIGNVLSRLDEMGDSRELLLAAEIYCDTEEFGGAGRILKRLNGAIASAGLNGQERKRAAIIGARVLAETEGWPAARKSIGSDDASLEKLVSDLESPRLQAELLRLMSSYATSKPAEKLRYLKEAVGLFATEPHFSPITEAEVCEEIASLYYENDVNLDANYLEFAQSWSTRGWEAINASDEWSASSASRLANFLINRVDQFEDAEEVLGVLSKIEPYRALEENTDYLDLELLKTEINASLMVEDSERATKAALRYLEIANAAKEAESVHAAYAMSVLDFIANTTDNHVKIEGELKRILSSTKDLPARKLLRLAIEGDQGGASLPQYAWIELYDQTRTSSAKTQIQNLTYWAESTASKGQTDSALAVGRILLEALKIDNEKPADDELRLLKLFSQCGVLSEVRIRLDQIARLESTELKDFAATQIVVGLYRAGKTSEALSFAKEMAVKLEGSSEQLRAAIWEIGNEIDRAGKSGSDAWDGVSDLFRD